MHMNVVHSPAFLSIGILLLVGAAIATPIIIKTTGQRFLSFLLLVLIASFLFTLWVSVQPIPLWFAYFIAVVFGGLWASTWLVDSGIGQKRSAYALAPARMR